LVTSYIKTLLIILSISLLTACEMFTSVPTGRIRIKNDLSGPEFSRYSVSGGGMSRSLAAGEAVLLPVGTYNFSINYRARDGNRSYRVQCPSNSKLGITIRLIDVHSDRMSGGCATVGGSHRR